MARTNWKRSYSIEFGTPTVVTDDYYRSSFSEDAYSSTQSLPSNALKISNLAADGFSTRGFVFNLDTKRTSGANSSDKEKTTVELYNLSPRMVEVLNKPNCIVQIKAGYQETVNLVYRGYVQRVDRKADSSGDVIYRVQCKDSWIDLSNTKITGNLSESYSIYDVILALLETLPSVGTPLIYADALTSKYYTGGFSFDGNVMEEFEKLCRQFKLVYSIQDGKILVTPSTLSKGDDDYNNMASNTYVFTANVVKSLDAVNDNSSSTGKENTKRNVVLTTFLIPIRFDQFFTIPSSVDTTLAGTYKVKTIQFKLQSRGSSWDTIIEGEPL